MTRHHQWKLLDQFRRRAYIKTELRRMLLRSFTNSKDVPLSKRYVAHFGLSHLPRHGSRNKIQNRCIQSGRNWNIMRKTQYSRFVFRDQSYFSYLPAVRRASW